MLQRQIVILLAGFGLAPVSLADELIMNNGSRLVGTLVSADASGVVFDTPFAGKITIARGNIERVVGETPVTLMMADGSIYRDKKIVASETSGEVLVMKDGTQPVAYPVTDIEIMNPEPWRLGDGYKWFGNLSGALQAERGNTDTDELDFAAKSVWRSLEDRYTLQGNMELDETSGVKSSDNWTALGQYDRFRQNNPDDYYGMKVRFEYDKFADLDLRTTIGPHIGRQFFESPYLSLRGEVGPVWVDEQFDMAEDDDWAGAMWVLQGSSDIIGYGTSLYITHDGIFNFDETDEMILNTTLGIKLPLVLGFETAFEAKFEYDGGAVEGVDDTDETYSFRIGYNF